MAVNGTCCLSESGKTLINFKEINGKVEKLNGAAGKKINGHWQVIFIFI